MAKPFCVSPEFLDDESSESVRELSCAENLLTQEDGVRDDDDGDEDVDPADLMELEVSWGSETQQEAQPPPSAPQNTPVVPHSYLVARQAKPQQDPRVSWANVISSVEKM